MSKNKLIIWKTLTILHKMTRLDDPSLSIMRLIGKKSIWPWALWPTKEVLDIRSIVFEETMTYSSTYQLKHHSKLCLKYLITTDFRIVHFGLFRVVHIIITSYGYDVCNTYYIICRSHLITSIFSFSEYYENDVNIIVKLTNCPHS